MSLWGGKSDRAKTVAYEARCRALSLFMFPFDESLRQFLTLYCGYVRNRFQKSRP